MTADRREAPVLLYLLHCGNLYGTERMALATLEGLSEYRRVVVAPPPYAEGSVAVAAARAGYESVTFRGRFGLVRALLPWFVKHRAIDAIGTGVVHSAVCHVLAKLMFVRLRQLHVAHGGTPDSFNQKHVLNRFPVTLVAVSEFVKRQLVQRGVRERQIVVIDNFLSREQRAAGVERPPYAVADRAAPVRVAVVSRVDPIKRVDLLIAAIEAHGLAGFEFDVYGVGTELDAMTRRAAPLANIRFHGYVADVQNRLAESDLLLLLCPEEPFGLVVLEAFLARVLVIVPGAGGAGSLVDDGVNGLTFRADDVDDLVRVLDRARKMPPEERQRLADAGRVALDARFSSERGATRYREAFATAR